jgi:16S rRNA (cytidine1402-2'-O)-methyltransferase
MLYLVGLPVGNWNDMPPRNIEIIENATNLVVENKGEYEEFLLALNIKTPNAKMFYMSTDTIDKENIEIEVSKEVLNVLLNGEDVCFLSDDGMPGLADPGQFLIQKAIENKIPISATPGPSSIIAAAAVSGCVGEFFFKSFFHKEKNLRLQQIKLLKNQTGPFIFMLRNAWNEFLPEILEVLEELENILGDRNAVLCYNLTTDKETSIRGTFSYLREYHLNNRKTSDKVMLVFDGIDPKHDRLPMPKDL